MKLGAHNSSGSGRFGSIDVVRGIGIFLVVVGHNQFVLAQKSIVFKLIYSFHMPLFFLLSGVFLPIGSSFRSFLVSRVDGLLKPYLVIACITSLIHFHSFYQSFKYSTMLVLYANGGTLDWTPLWFLPNLFLSQILVYGILTFVRKKFFAWKLVAMLLSAVMLFVGTSVMKLDWANDGARLATSFFPSPHISGMPGLPWSTDLLGVTGAFILIGYVLKDEIISLKLRLSTTTLVGVLFIIVQLTTDKTIDLNMRRYDDLFISTFDAVLGVIFTLSLARHIGMFSPFGKLISFLGRASIFVLIFHFPIQNHLFFILSKFGNMVAVPVSIAAGLLLPALAYKFAKENIYFARLFLRTKR